MKIAIDLDGTIVDFKTDFKKKIKALYNITCKDGYIDARSIYRNLPTEYKDKYKDHRDIYSDVCDVGFFRNLKPYPGAIKAVNRLFDAGHEVYFLTKVLNWDRSAPEKAEWLQKYFKNKKYRTIMVDSVKGKHIVDVDIIVDDDKRVLADGLATKICIAQPWNEEFRKNNSKILVAKSIVDAVDLIINVLSSSCDEWNRIWCE